MSRTGFRPVTYGLDASMARFSLARYQRMIEVGILDRNDHVELLEGYVVLKMPRDPSHDGTIDLVNAGVRPLIPAGWIMRVQQSIAFDESQPEPDFAIVRGNPRSFLTRHPAPSDVGLIVEVANTSLMRDMRDKARIYASAGIPTYWVINVTDRVVEVFTQPSGPTISPTYSNQQTLNANDTIVFVLDGTLVASLPVADLLA